MSDNRVLLASIAGTTASVFPAFLTGAVAVQLSADMGLTQSQLGLVIGAFFTSAAVGSAMLGRVAERLGPFRAMRLGLGLTVLTGLALAQSGTPVVLGGLLLVAGTSNALIQPAANLLLAGTISPGRMGFAFALKQAGMPAASLLGGLAVPALALTVGWRWAYVVGAVLAGLSIATIPPAVEQPSALSQRLATTPRPDLATGLLVLYGLVGLIGAATAGAVVTFLVSGAEASGISPGAAGLLLTGGSVVGIASRIQHGRWADGPRLLPIRRVAMLLALGSAGAFVLAFQTPPAYLLGLVPVFAFGWAWPGLFNLSVVRNNPSAPAAATGVTQTGIYIGAGVGPVLGGMIVQTTGFSALWVSVGVGLLIAAATALVLRILLRRNRQATAVPIRA